MKRSTLRQNGLASQVSDLSGTGTAKFSLRTRALCTHRMQVLYCWIRLLLYQGGEEGVLRYNNALVDKAYMDDKANHIWDILSALCQYYVNPHNHTWELSVVDDMDDKGERAGGNICLLYDPFTRVQASSRTSGVLFGPIWPFTREFSK